MELERIRKGDTEALGALLADAWAPLVQFLARMTESDDAAEDAAQEAFVRLWERRERWTEGSARAVLFRIARNVALDQTRRLDVRARFADSVPRPSRPSTPVDDLSLLEARSRVDEALAALPARRRQLFELVRFDGMSYREAAHVLDLSPQTVANQMSLALRDLRTLLSDFLPPVAPSDIDGADGQPKGEHADG